MTDKEAYSTENFDKLVKEIDVINPEAARIILKRSNLLERTAAKNIDSLLQCAFRTYHESFNRGESTHLDIPMNARSVDYVIEQIVYSEKDYAKANKFASRYRKAAMSLLKLDTKLRKTDTRTEKKLEEFVRYDKAYNSFLDAHSEAYEIIGKPANGKHPYQTGIQ